MQSQRQQKVATQLAQLAAEFLEQESNRQALITVTRADLSPDFANATIFLSVIPESYEQSALDFARRKRTDFRTYIKKKAYLRRLPFFEFELDAGEKHRQNLDRISQEIHKND